MISLEKSYILAHGYTKIALGKLIVAKGFKKLLKVQ